MAAHLVAGAVTEEAATVATAEEVAALAAPTSTTPPTGLLEGLGCPSVQLSSPGTSKT